jgi:hypothetical protein
MSSKPRHRRLSSEMLGGVSLTEVMVWFAVILAAALVVLIGAFVTRQ